MKASSAWKIRSMSGQSAHWAFYHASTLTAEASSSQFHLLSTAVTKRPELKTQRGSPPTVNCWISNLHADYVKFKIHPVLPFYKPTRSFFLALTNSQSIDCFLSLWKYPTGQSMAGCNSAASLLKVSLFSLLFWNAAAIDLGTQTARAFKASLHPPSISKACLRGFASVLL